MSSTDSINLAGDINFVSYDELISIHKKQQKNLLSTITSLKKQSNKKTRKNVNSKCNDLQFELDEKQKKELIEWKSINGESVDDNDEDEFSPEKLLAQLALNDSTKPTQEEPSTTPSGEEKSTTQEINSAPKKRNRQKERIAKRNAQIKSIQDDARIEAESSIDYKKIEQDSMEQILNHRNLKVFDIKPDGNCLFSSIKDQLEKRHYTLTNANDEDDDDDDGTDNNTQLDISIENLRKLSAQYIKQHENDFIPFLFDTETMEQKNLDKYIDDLQNTSMWGSDLEITALANVFNCSITVFTAGGSPITFNENGTKPDLKLGFYRYSYGLGEHYNSLRDA